MYIIGRVNKEGAMKNRRLTKSIVALVAIAVLTVPGMVFAQTKAEYPVDKIEFQKNGFMSDGDAKLPVENAKRGAALQVYLWSLPRISMEYRCRPPLRLLPRTGLQDHLVVIGANE
jgi:hypothetical protein